MKHTQGPWLALERYTDRNSIPIGHKRPDGSTSIFAECNGLGGVTGQTEGDANARLIAAAPELLAALELAQATIERLSPARPFDSTQGTRDVIRLAIAKATA